MARPWKGLAEYPDVSFLDRRPELFDRSLLERYYTRERLQAGREQWREPDLHPLELPPPSRSGTSSG